MTPPVYPSLQHSEFSAQRPVNIPRPSGVVRGTPNHLTCSGDSAASQIATSPTTGKQTRRKFAIDIIDTKSMKNIDIYEDSVASSCIPSHFGKSSARNTPPPNTDPGALDVVAEFAKLLAKAASE